LSKIEVFGQENGGHICYLSYFRPNRVYKRELEILGGKMKLFPKKVIRKFPSSQCRRQVSANDQERISKWI